MKTKKDMTYSPPEPGPDVFVPAGTELIEVYHDPYYVEFITPSGETIGIQRGSEEAKNLEYVAQYCSERCERASVSDLHGSMPGAGKVPYRNWVPGHISNEISNRWQDEED